MIAAYFDILLGCEPRLKMAHESEQLLVLQRLLTALLYSQSTYIMLFLKFLLLKPTYQSSTQARQIQRINSLRLLHLASSRLIFRALLIISITLERHSFTFIIAVLHLQYLSSKLIHIDFVYDKVLTKTPILFSRTLRRAFYLILT